MQLFLIFAFNTKLKCMILAKNKPMQYKEVEKNRNENFLTVSQ